MFTPSKLNRIALAVAVSIGFATPVFAQETSSGLSGKVVTPAGAPAAGTAVKIIHVPSGTVRNTVVNASGSFNLKGLRVGVLTKSLWILIRSKILRLTVYF